MASVDLENVTKIFPGGVTAVDNASLSVGDGEFLVLVGPSGCGKSSILRMIAGLEELTEGAVRIDGQEVNEVPAKDRDIAMVFQNYALYPHMSVQRNMAFGLELRHYPRDEIEARVVETARVLGLDRVLDRKPGELSGGQRQRVALGRAIVRHPRVFLFDEPLSNLDATLRIEMRAELKALHSRLKTTMIYVTHDQVEAMTLGDRIVVLREGIIQQAAEPLQLYTRPSNLFVAGFIGSPPMNIIPGAVSDSGSGLHFRSRDGSVDLPLPESQSQTLLSHQSRGLLLGVRPEELSPFGGGSLNQDAAIEGVVDNIEPTGSESFLHLRVGSNKVVARVDASFRPEPGSSQVLRVPMDRVHYFDPETERSIARPAG